jgi:CBS domain containing-hemolysin-like protein
MDFSLFTGILASLLLAIFFSGIEVAFLSANKIQIELLGKQGNPAGLIMTFFTERPTWFIGTTLIGNIASLVFFWNIFYESFFVRDRYVGHVVLSCHRGFVFHISADGNCPLYCRVFIQKFFCHQFK